MKNLKFFEEHNITLLSPFSNKDKMKVKLGCGHTFFYKLNSLKKYVRVYGKVPCKYCKGTHISKETLKEEIKRTTEDEYKLISCHKNLKARSKVKILHKNCKHIYEVTVTNFRQGKRCPYCAQKRTDSKASVLLTTLLEFFKIKFEKEKTFENLKNPLTGRDLRYDFYLPEYNILIEIDGAQHYQNIPSFHNSSLSNIQYRDNIKDKFAIKNNIKLYRIPLINPFNGNSLSSKQTRRLIFNFLFKLLMEDCFERVAAA